MKRIWMMIPMVIVLLLAACSSPQSGGSGSVPETGSTATVPVLATSTTEAGGVAGTAVGTAAVPEGCVGVDTQALVTTGQQYFEANCASCHGAQGEGTGDFPALANNTLVNSQDPVALITRFFSVPAHPKTITPDQAAAVFTYMRGAFGNTGQPICPSQVLENIPTQ